MVCIYNAAPVIKITYCIDCVQLLFDMQARNPGKPSSRKPRSIAHLGALVWVFVSILMLSAPMLTAAQNPGYSPSGSEPDSGAAQISLPSGQSPFSGSVAQGKVTPDAIPLTFQDAIDLGLKNNLGVLLQSYNTLAARGQKWKELSSLLPNVSAGVGENVAQQNLAAEG